MRSSLFLLVGLVLSYPAARAFLPMRITDSIMAGEGVTKVRPLSDYFGGIRGTRGDTDVYFLEGERPGATILVLGGTHPNEPAGYVSAVCLIENVRLTQGRLIVVPRTNNSGFTHDDPQEGTPQYFTIPTARGERRFRFGSRATNPVDQWPDPQVYLHYPSRQKLSGLETRNLNRAYPGRPNGTLTEKIAYAITEMMRQEGVNLGIDLHEASLEYPVINAMVAHPLANDLVAEAVIYLQMKGLDYSLEPSPENFHGLSHREWGDHLQIPAILLETANVVQGRYRGRTTPELVLTGKDRFHYEAGQHGLLEVPYPEEGIPLEERVGRHLLGVQQIVEVWSANHPEEAVIIENIPDYGSLLAQGVGAFLH
ncbi:MAG: succinylglutamate desuccinylase/aspartoacylase family protein [Candidatus Neomarinimicrobiota bacterium]